MLYGDSVMIDATPPYLFLEFGPLSLFIFAMLMLL